MKEGKYILFRAKIYKIATSLAPRYDAKKDIAESPTEVILQGFCAELVSASNLAGMSVGNATNFKKTI
ncbi:hypothetical protein [Hwangdonia sp.]|uniref:hypothetical protein n=1 Tax=Hwangdonia sp. TaxID=1883432 RepID=UPI003AB5E27D